jgi:L-2-hydroxyglutarate oxidase
MNKYDFCIVGVGIVGMATAHAILTKCPKAKIFILEKASVPGFPVR